MKFFFVFVLVFVIISYLCTQLLEIRLSGGVSTILWKKINKRLLLFGILQNLAHSKEQNPKNKLQASVRIAWT